MVHYCYKHICLCRSASYSGPRGRTYIQYSAFHSHGVPQKLDG